MSDGPRTGAARGVLTWAVATPFFAMPLPLTLLAWDLYGGFAIHGKLLLALAVLGALLGVLWRARTRWSRKLSELLPAGAGGSASRTEAVLLLLILSQALALASVAVAPGIARLLHLWKPEADGTTAGTIVGPLVYAALVVMAGLRNAGDDDGDRRFGGTLAAGWLLLVVCEFGALVAGWPAWVSAAVLGVASGALLAHPLGPRVGGILGRLAPTVFVGSFAWLLLSRAPEVVFGLDPRPLAVRLGVAAAALVVSYRVFVALPLRPIVGPRIRGLLDALASASAPIGGVTPVAAMAGFVLAVLSLPLATLGGLCGELAIPALRIGVDPSGPITIAGPSRLGDLGLVLGMMRLGMISRDGPGLTRLYRWVGAAFTLAALAGIGSILMPPLRLGADLVLLALGVVPWIPRIWERSFLHTQIARLLALGPVVGLPVLARYIAAAFPLLADPATLATLGALLGLPTGLALARLRVPAGLTPAHLLRNAVLGLLAIGLLIYLAVFFAIAPDLCALTLALLGVGLGVTRAPFWTLPRLPLAVAAWLAFYASFAAVVVFKEGPDAESCAELLQRTEARVLLDRFGEGGLYPTGDPYDLLPDPTGRWLVTTFKRFDDHGGWIEVIDVADPSRRTRTLTRPPNNEGPFWPERFDVHAGTGRYYFGMLGIGQYELWEMEFVHDGPVPRLARTRSAPMSWEPSYPDVDERRDVLVQGYLSAGVEERQLLDVEQPLIHPIPLDSLEGERGFSMGRDVEEMSEFVAVHPQTGNYWTPGYFNLVRFALVEVDAATLRLVRRKETFHPTIAIGFADDRLFVTNSLGGTLEVYDTRSMERTATVPSGAFPRDLVVDAEGERVYVGNYSSGTVVEFDVSTPVPKAVRAVEVGPLLRGIGIHEPTGAVYAASACGVFAVAEGRQ